MLSTKADTFSLVQVKAQTKDNVTYLPLACLFADFCERTLITQEQLRWYLGRDIDHPMNEASFKRLSLVTVNVQRLIDVLQSVQVQQAPLPVVPVRRRGRPPKGSIR